MENNVNLKQKNIPNWITVADACDLLNLKEKTLRIKCWKGEYNYKIEKIGRKNAYFININSLPNDIKNKLLHTSEYLTQENGYSDAPNWAKFQAEKYIYILKQSKYLKGQNLKNFIIDWNCKNPEYQTSYSCLMYMKKRFKEFGLQGLLARYGHKNQKTAIINDYFNYFKNLYLVEGAPSLQSCWEQTLGFAMRTTPTIRKQDFPSHMAFKRKLQKEVPEQSIYLARYGKSAWNKKFGGYIERDYSNVQCGKVWVSDHAQIDVACLTPEGDVTFPWVTAWRDFKSSKWLGWLLQYNHPNSDHIFQTFYYAAEEFGLPEDVIIDNGKDYRSKDFAGGRKNIKIDSNESKTTSMLAELNVEVHFALPYNAQTKPIERDFLKIKELLSKHCVGYRGGNIVERPEKLADEIKQGKIMNFEDFKKLFNDFIINVLNKRPSQGKNLKGLSPDDLFNKEFTEKIVTSKDALKLFCMRTSRNFTIGRNGIKDNSLGITYWADWLVNKTGVKVYLRRDINNYKEAWVFRIDNDEFIGKVTAVKAVAALHADKISKEEFKEAISIKKRNLKIAKSYIEQNKTIPFEEQCENYKAAYSAVEKRTEPKISRIANTNMDKAIRKNKEFEEFGKYDLSMFIDETPVADEPFYLFETDKILAEERNLRLKGVVNGY